jgi:hypothetical protein
MKILMRMTMLSAVLMAAPVHAQKLSDAFMGEKEKNFRKSFEQLAMLPIQAAPVASMPNHIKELIRDEVVEILEDEDFVILPETEATTIRQQLADLYTEPDNPAHKAAIEEHAARELLYRHPVDGAVSVQVLAIAAPFANDKAEWDGTSQKMEHKGDGFFGTVMGKDYGGHVAASTIRIEVTDRSGRVAYRWAGGIEVMMSRNGTTLEPLPTEQLWQSEKRVKKAVAYALKPF